MTGPETPLSSGNTHRPLDEIQDQPDTASSAHLDTGVIQTALVTETRRNDVFNTAARLLVNGIDRSGITDQLKDVAAAENALNDWLDIYLTRRLRVEYQLPATGTPRVSNLRVHERVGAREYEPLVRGISMDVRFSEAPDPGVEQTTQFVIANKVSSSNPSLGMDTYIIGEASGFETVEECLASTAVVNRFS